MDDSLPHFTNTRLATRLTPFNLLGELLGRPRKHYREKLPRDYGQDLFFDRGKQILRFAQEDKRSAIAISSPIAVAIASQSCFRANA